MTLIVPILSACSKPSVNNDNCNAIMPKLKVDSKCDCFAGGRLEFSQCCDWTFIIGDLFKIF